MAYTIISQNNTTTTLADENGNVITVPARVTLATSTDYTITKVNNNSVDLVDGNGKVIRGVPACVVLAGEGGGGGGGDQHNLGYYATQAALEEAHPTAEAGDWAIVGSTDTVWIWDTDNSEWVDSDQKGQVTSVNGQTGDVVLDLLPTQTGNAGKFLTTDGTDASWGSALVNNTTNNGSLSILGTTTATNSNEVIIGSGAIGYTGNYNGSNVVIGKGAGYSYNHIESVIIGTDTQGRNKSVIIGNMAWGLQHNVVAIGANARVNAQGAIQINTSDSIATNSDANTFKVANANGNFEIMSADGTIPHGRLTNALASTTVTIAVADWNGGTTVSKTVSGLTATSVVFASPDGSSMSEWASAGVYASGQATDTLTFTASSTPTASITVVVAYC